MSNCTPLGRDARITATGHIDTSGPEAYNMARQCGRRRAGARGRDGDGDHANRPRRAGLADADRTTRRPSPPSPTSLPNKATGLPWMSTGRRAWSNGSPTPRDSSRGHDFKEVAANNGDVPVKAGGKKEAAGEEAPA